MACTFGAAGLPFLQRLGTRLHRLRIQDAFDGLFDPHRRIFVADLPCVPHLDTQNSQLGFLFFVADGTQNSERVLLGRSDPQILMQGQ